MKIVSKRAILEAEVFTGADPLPEGVTRITRESRNAGDVSYEFRSTAQRDSWLTTPISPGDVIITEYDVFLNSIRQAVISKERLDEEFIVLGAVEPR